MLLRQASLDSFRQLQAFSDFKHFESAMKGTGLTNVRSAKTLFICNHRFKEEVKGDLKAFQHHQLGDSKLFSVNSTRSRHYHSHLHSKSRSEIGGSTIDNLSHINSDQDHSSEQHSQPISSSSTVGPPQHIQSTPIRQFLRRGLSTQSQ